MNKNELINEKTTLGEYDWLDNAEGSDDEGEGPNGSSVTNVWQKISPINCHNSMDEPDPNFVTP